MTATLLVAAGPVVACQVTDLLTPERAASSDFVLAGHVTTYSPNAWDSFPGEPRYALVRMEVIEVWKGDPGEIFEFVLTDAEMPLMRDWQWPDDIIIAADLPAPGDGTADKTAGETGDTHPRNTLPKVWQSICSMAFAPVTSETLAAYRSHFPGAQ